MPAGSSDDQHMCTQLAKGYPGPRKEGGSDPLYVAYPMKRIKTLLECCQVRTTDDSKAIGAFARLGLPSCLVKDLSS